MSTAATPMPAVDRPRFAALAVGAFALVALALHVANASRYGYFRDELYYVMCGRRLAWGYVDHPPLIALVAAFAERVLGGSLIALRLPVALAHAALVFVAGVMAQRMGGGRAAQVLAAIAVLIAPVYLVGASVLNMNPFDQLLWSLCVLVLIDGLTADRAPNWIRFGAIAGVGLLDKHSFAFFLPAAFVAVAISPQRTLLRTRGPWIAALIAAAIAAPNLVWEIRHYWPTLEFLHNAAEHKNYSGSPLEFLSAQVMIMNPFNLPLVLAGLVWLLAAAGARRVRAIGLGFVAIFVLLFAMKAKHYYLAPAYPAVLAAGAVAVESFARASRRWIVPAYATVMLASGAAFAPLVVPMLAPESFVRYAKALGIHEPQSERHRRAKLPQTFADMFGWEELAAQVGGVYQALSPAERAHCFIFASNYGEAAALEWYGPRYGLPKVASGHNSYFLWGPPDTLAQVVITVGEDSSDVAKSLESVERAGTFSHSWNMPYESDLPILIGRRLRMPWREIWPNTKKYI
jgi:dolichyl-phosphate-mannose-protein mannosyltransferase